MMNTKSLPSPNHGRVMLVNPDEAGQKEIRFRSEAQFLQQALGVIPRGTVILLSGMGGANKTTAALQCVIDFGLRSHGQSLLISTEMTRERILSRLQSLMSHLSQNQQAKVYDAVEIVDNFADVSFLPQYLAQRLASSPERIPDLLIVDSLHGQGIHSNSSRTYERIYELFRLCRATDLTLLAITHSTKQGGGKPAGPNTLSHSADALAVILSASRNRFLLTTKNRNGISGQEPICLKVEDKSGRLVPNKHVKSMAATAQSFLPGYPNVEVQVALEIPKITEKGRLIAPNLPKAEIVQLLGTIEKIPKVDFHFSEFVTNIQVPGERLYRRFLHLPIAMAAISAFSQVPIDRNVFFLGEIDLNRRLRSLPEAVMVGLDSALQSGLFPDGSTIFCPSLDAPFLTNTQLGAKVIGLDELAGLS